jgi:large subunit ribosomal protein L35
MPKMKTSKSIKKRVKVTGSGKLKRRKAFLGHLLSGKRPKRKRRLKRGGLIKAADERRMNCLLGRR